MTYPSLNSKDKIPYHIHKGENIQRITAIILLTTLIIFSIYSIKHVGYFMIILLLGSLFGLICIRFPKIVLYDDSFVILKKCLINRFTDRDVFKYDEINKVEFSEGFIDWNYVIVMTLFGSGGFGGNSKADQIFIKTKDNNTYVFNRFGSKSEFIKTIELINKRINSSTNNKADRNSNLREG